MMQLYNFDAAIADALWHYNECSSTHNDPQCEHDTLVRIWNLLGGMFKIIEKVDPKIQKWYNDTCVHIQMCKNSPAGHDKDIHKILEEVWDQYTKDLL